MKHYAIMKKFHQSEGHSCVPPKGNFSKTIPGVSESELKQCGRFVSHLRHQRRMENEHGKLGKYIPPYMVQKLKDLQFEYKVANNNDSRQYSRLVSGLVQFKKDNGHCNVAAIHKMPDNVPDLLKLYEWARKNKCKFSKARLEQLQNLGFSFDEEFQDSLDGSGAMDNEAATVFGHTDEEDFGRYGVDTGDVDTNARRLLASASNRGDYDGAEETTGRSPRAGLILHGDENARDPGRNASEFADGSRGSSTLMAVAHNNEASSDNGGNFVSIPTENDNNDSNNITSEARINCMTVVKLRTELKKYGLNQKGLKADLRQRLIDHMSSTMPFNEVDNNGGK